ncbi:hypothetical protein V502_05922 [Pseudogymnoascus sp. VKM F-4520 (FW-2644)]|nr:hypothetical protein V502_05922 [Pseudogymnoascus sp. VKM F-4520 (FW-2644)]
MWTLLQQVSMESLMTAFMAAIPDEVKVALGGATIDYNAILSVDRDWLHYQVEGVYLNLAFDKSTKEDGFYVGSKRRQFHIRVERHLKIVAQYTPDTLPLYHGGTVFRNTDVPPGYVYLLEAIMMILLQTIPLLRNGNNWHNQGTHNIVKKLQVFSKDSVWTGPLARTRTNRLNTPEEKAALLKRRDLIVQRRTGPLLCGNCSDPKSPAPQGQHVYVKEVGTMWCTTCAVFYRRTDQHRDMARVRTTTL